jgi:alkyl hydroperoxide reductase subunit AhpF
MPGLISPADQERLRRDFEKIARDVRLLFFTQTFDCETCLQTRRVLDELPALSPRISIEEVNLILDRERADQFGVDRAPAVVVLAARTEGASDAFDDTRIRFLGTPAGYEFISLVQAVLLAGGGPSRLTIASRDRLANLTRPVTMQVFTTPT